MQDHSSCCRCSMMQAYKYLINKSQGGKEGRWKEGEKANKLLLSGLCNKLLQDLQWKTFSRLRGMGKIFQKCVNYLIYSQALVLYFLCIFTPKWFWENGFKHLTSCLIMQVPSTQQFLKSNKLHHHISNPPNENQALHKLQSLIENFMDRKLLYLFYIPSCELDYHAC